MGVPVHQRDGNALSAFVAAQNDKLPRARRGGHLRFVQDEFYHHVV